MAGKPLIHVEGIKELRKALRAVDPALLPEVRDELKKVGEVVVGDARARLTASLGKNLKRPSRSTGRAASSLRVTGGGNVVYIVGGKASVPYFGWLDFGGELKPVGGRKNHQSRPFITEGRSIYPAAAAHVQDVQEAAYRAIDSAARKAELK